MFHVHVGVSSSSNDAPGLTQEEIAFAAGSVEILRGAVKFFRDKGVPVQSAPGQSRTLLCIAVPPMLSASDWCQFTSQVAPSIQHQRIIRPLGDRGGPYCVLMRFVSQEKADAFYRGFSGKPFTSFGTELCHPVYVAEVRLQRPSAQVGAVPECATSSTGCGESTPLLTTDPLVAPATDDQGPIVIENCVEQADPPNGPATANEGAAVSVSRAGAVLTELPTCPICLERLDGSVSGLMTTSCNHSFHGTCLSRWATHSCPVCRFTLGGEDDSDAAGDGAAGGGGGHGTSRASTSCQVCGVHESVWLCLICGFSGCGRFHNSHALEHARRTNHAYSLELRTQRVWSYADDSYVHRLIASQGGTKLIELPDPSGAGGGSGAGAGSCTPCCGEDGALLLEKSEGLSFEYTLLLTSQLEAQRAYFEDLLTRLLSCVPESDSARRTGAEEIVHSHALVGSRAASHSASGGAMHSGALSATAAAYFSDENNGLGGVTGGDTGSVKGTARRRLSLTGGGSLAARGSSDRPSALANAASASHAAETTSLKAELAKLGAQAAAVPALRAQVAELTRKCGELQSELDTVTARATTSESGRRQMVRQCENATERAAQALEELAFLREVNENLVTNQASWEARLAKVQAAAQAAARAAAEKVADLEAQLRDLYFTLETRDKVERADEATRADIQGGSIIATSPTNAAGGGSKRQPAAGKPTSTKGGTGAAATAAGRGAGDVDESDDLPSLFGKGRDRARGNGGKAKK